MEYEMADLPIEWTINAGTIIGVICVAAGFYATTRSDLKKIKEDLIMLNKTVSEIAVQNTRLDNQDTLIIALQKQMSIHEERVYQLSKGKGWIKQENRHGIDGEYSS